MNYFQLDSRAGIISCENDGKLICEDPGKYILTVGTLKEVCREVNSGDYGDNNIVCDENYVIPWGIYNTEGHWSYKEYLKLQNEQS